MAGTVGRPSLGSQARKVVASTKISEAEKAALIAAHGTVHKGLRVALDQYLSMPAQKRRARPKAKEPAQDVVPEPLEPAAGVVRCRVHRNYRVVRRWVDRGQEWTLKRCADCGTEVTVLDHG